MMHAAGLASRMALIVLGVAAMAAALAALDVAVTRRAPAAAESPAAHIDAARGVIAGEALVFTDYPDSVWARPSAARSAHPRTLATYRALRAYPGAPPRVPHGLTAAEFRTAACRTCHERGGYSQRFSAYAPVTPHPELTECLQCHTTDAAVTGMALPAMNPDALCRQCHGAVVTARTESALDWQSARWPAAGVPAADGTPPPIPHTLELRGNCIACHAGPGAVRELRTAHPERGNCRQCHVTGTGADSVFTRPSPTHEGGGP